MQYAVALLALAASVSAQTATGVPSSCSTNYPKSFEIAPVNVSSSTGKRNVLEQRDIVCNTNPIITLKDGVLTDQAKSTGEVVANHQFQFDNPLQSPRLFDAGFSVCSNNTLAIGPNAVFFACKSGSFSNLYDYTLKADPGSIYDPAVCYEVYIQVLPCGSVQVSSAPGLSASTAAVSSAPATSAPATSTPSTPSAVATSSAVVSSVAVSSLPGPAIPTVAPYPTGNSTAPAGTASASAPGGATTTALTAPASGASALTMGSTFGVVAVALAAMAMF